MTDTHTQVQPSQFQLSDLQAPGTASSWLPDLRASPVLAPSINDPCLGPLTLAMRVLPWPWSFCLLLMAISLASLFLSGDRGSILLS